MLRQMVSPVERLLANITLKVVTSLVQFLVLIQVIPSVEALRAHITPERFNGRMGCDVSL